MIILLRRVVYFFYYVKKTEWRELLAILDHLEKQETRSRAVLFCDAVQSTFRYNISIEDFFYFKFYEKGHEVRSTFTGTGFMYEYHREMNPVESRSVLHDKLQFLRSYKNFVKHAFCLIEDIENNSQEFRRLIKETGDRLVLKDALGQCGWGVDVVSAETSREDLLALMRARGYNMAEAFVQQHPLLDELSPSGLNTVRVITFLRSDGEVEFLGAILRLTVNSVVDNIAMGNIAAPINLQSGEVESDAVYKDPRIAPVSKHPVTGKRIVGFRLPFWDDVLRLTERAAQHDPRNRSIGWDVAITAEGPSLIEGNHNWCKLLWQLPRQQGLKHKLLEHYQPD